MVISTETIELRRTGHQGRCTSCSTNAFLGKIWVAAYAAVLMTEESHTQPRLGQASSRTGCISQGIKLHWGLHGSSSMHSKPVRCHHSGLGALHRASSCTGVCKAAVPCIQNQSDAIIQDWVHLTGHQAALGYARQQFQAFKSSQMSAIQRLMGCLCYIKRPDSSPYADLMAPSRWEAVAQDFARQCCGLLGRVRAHPYLLPPLIRPSKGVKSFKCP